MSASIHFKKVAFKVNMSHNASMDARITIGSRVYLANAVAGEPGVVHEIDRKNYAKIEWVDLPELGRWTRHHIDSLIVDQAFCVRQLGLDFESQAA